VRVGAGCAKWYTVLFRVDLLLLFVPPAVVSLPSEAYDSASSFIVSPSGSTKDTRSLIRLGPTERRLMGRMLADAVLSYDADDLELDVEKADRTNVVLRDVGLLGENSWPCIEAAEWSNIVLER